MDYFEIIDKIVKCRSFKEAFLFDEVLSNVFGVRYFGMAAIKLWIIDHRYGALVNVRLHQMVEWKQLLNRKKMFESMRFRPGESKLSKIQKLRLVLGKPSAWKYVFRVVFYQWLSKLFDCLLYAVYSFSVSPFADIGKGLWGSMRNLGVATYPKIGKNALIHGNVTIASQGKYSPVLGDNVHIGTGAVIVGKVRIGNNVTIAPNSVVIANVPDNCTVMGNPARVVYRLPLK